MEQLETGMSAPGRPKSEDRSAQHEGTPQRFFARNPTTTGCQPMNTLRLATESQCAAAQRWHWTRQTNRTASDEVLAAVGGNEDRAARAHAWSQNPEYRGKEALFARMAGAPELIQALGDPAQTAAASAKLGQLQSLVADYATHRIAFDRLPARTVVDAPADPMRPVPDLGALNTLAKTELTPEFIASMKSRGYTYVNTATLVNIRHGETDGNKVSGGYFAGGLVGPWGAQLTPEAKQAASSLVPEVQKNASQISAVIVSPTDRAQGTFRRATQGVAFPSTTTFKVEKDFAEHHVGGLFGLKKPAKGAQTRESGVNGWIVGKTEDGNLGPDKNQLPRTYVPPVAPVYGSVPRVTPVRSEGDTESWEQMRVRVAEAVQRDVLPVLAQGKNVLVVSHQYVVGNQDAFFFPAEAGVGNDPLRTGHDVPNTAPQYWTAHVFKDAAGKLVVVPATVGQGQLAAPGLTPKGQTAPGATTP